MFYSASYQQAAIADDIINYIKFGTGKKTLILLPGLGDGLSPVHGQLQAFALAFGYRQFAKEYIVYLFSRRNHLKKNASTRSMAKDQAEAMKALGIKTADVIGVSQGGMIAQYLAIDFPDLVKKLVLAVTLSRTNTTVQQTVSEWIRLAQHGDYKNLIIDTAEKSYSEHHLRKIRLSYPLLTRLKKPKSFERFLIQAASCLQHNSYAQLNSISCPTLVIGGECDHIVGVDPSYDLAAQIQDSELYIYKGLGHAAFEEASDFNNYILLFCIHQKRTATMNDCSSPFTFF